MVKFREGAGGGLNLNAQAPQEVLEPLGYLMNP